MRVIDILNMIAKRQELPREIEYNGDIGILVKEKDFINYILEKDGDKFDLYWLIDHDLNNLNDNVKVLRRTK